MMSSSFFINYSMGGLRLSYRLLGKTLTNWIVNKSAGDLFTSGPNTNTLIRDIYHLEKRNIGGIGNYVVEGIETMNEEKIA